VELLGGVSEVNKVTAYQLDYHISVLDGGSDFSLHHYSSVGTATDYVMDGRWAGVQFLSGATDFSSPQRADGTHLFSCPVGTVGVFLEVKAARV
jgi:hypothetical protein